MFPYKITQISCRSKTEWKQTRERR